MTEKELILTSLLGCQRSELYLKELELEQDQRNKFNFLIEQRLKGKPLQYLLGFTEFMGLRLKVDKRALIPRVETEILVEEAINLVKDLRPAVKNILDIGTGSGNIAIALLKFLPETKITALDISETALALAKENAVLNNLEQRIEFLTGDFFSEPLLGLKQKFYDLIISNPPYIPTGDLANLPKDVQEEPQIASDGGQDGLKFYRGIIQKADKFLKKSGGILLELGYGQSKAIVEMFEQQKFKILKVVKDYAGIERVIIAELI